MGFFFIFCLVTYSQDQKKADSLELIYSKGVFNEQDRLIILKKLAIENADPFKKLNYSNALIKLAKSLDSIEYLYFGYLNKGTALRAKGDLSKALDSYIEAGKIATQLNSIKKQGKVNITIGDVYSVMGSHKNAINYYQTAIDILRDVKDSTLVAKVLYNAGDEYVKSKKYDTALIYFNESISIFKKENNLIYIAYNLGSMGMVYAGKGNHTLAKKYINQAILILEKLKDYSPISEFLISLSDIYADQNNFTKAFSYAKRSLELAERYGLKQQIGFANLKLSELFEQTGNFSESLKLYKNYIVYRDSVKNVESVQQMADMRYDFDMDKKQNEIGILEKEAVITELRAKRQRIMNIASASAAVLILLLTISYYRRYRFSKKTNLIIEEEKNRSQKLLLNILPKKTAGELIHKGKVEAKKFDSVSVMFTDFKDFTSHSTHLSPETLVSSVDFYYSKFDDIIEKYDLEKIKTIGDSYMCAGGLPFATEDHAEKMIKAAIEITKFMEKTRASNDESISNFDIRIGINSGPVVAGVVGKTKFAYDIWGDTVNVASRMESNSEPGKINISENTYALIKDHFDCEYRGKIKVKNRGMMKMYFVNGLKNLELSAMLEESQKSL